MASLKLVVNRFEDFDIPAVAFAKMPVNAKQANKSCAIQYLRAKGPTPERIRGTAIFSSALTGEKRPPH